MTFSLFPKPLPPSGSNEKPKQNENNENKQFSKNPLQKLLTRTKTNKKSIQNNLVPSVDALKTQNENVSEQHPISRWNFFPQRSSFVSSRDSWFNRLKTTTGVQQSSSVQNNNDQNSDENIEKIDNENNNVGLNSNTKNDNSKNSKSPTQKNNHTQLDNAQKNNHKKTNNPQKNKNTQQFTTFEDKLSNFDFQEQWYKTFPSHKHKKLAEQHIDHEINKNKSLSERIFYARHAEKFTPKVNITEGVGENLSTLESLKSIGGLGVAAGFLGFNVLCWLEWGLVVMLSVKYQPLGKILKHPSAPMTFRKARERLMKGADKGLSAFVEKTKNVPIVHRFLPKKITHDMGVGFLEGNLLYYGMLTFLIPLNLGIVEYSLAMFHLFHPKAIAARALELERQFEKQLQDKVGIDLHLFDSENDDDEMGDKNGEAVNSEGNEIVSKEENNKPKHLEEAVGKRH